MDKPGSHLEALEGGRQTRRLTTILVADICGYSRMSEKDQDAAIRTADLLYKLFEDVTARHGGRVFKRIADGFLAEYPSARSGMQAALDYAKEVKARNNLAPNAINADIRAGIHVGDVTDRPDGDILGHGVNVAARLQELADPGTVLASSNIMNLTRKDIPFKINKRTGLALKNITDPMTAFQIDPEKSGGGFDIQIPKIFKSKALLYTALAGVVIYGAMEFQGQRAEAAWEEQIERIIGKIEEESSGKNSVSEPYIRSVIENLRRSKIPTKNASLSLLEQGNIGQAIENLEEALESFTSTDPEYVETLHQIAALSYYKNPQKALSAYETILEINKNDKTAFLWLFRTNNLLLRPQDSIEFYQNLLKSQELNDDEFLRLQMDMAFTLMVQGEFQAAKDMLEPLESKIISQGDERFFIRWNIELGFVNERLGNLQDAENLVSTAIEKLEKIGADSSLPRALNVMGLIHEKYAMQAERNREYHLNEALKAYKRQLDAGKLIEKEREIAEAHQYMARVKFDLGDIDGAREDYLYSYRIARANNYTNSEFKSLLGFAQLDTFENKRKEACINVKKAEALFEKRMGPNLGPTSRKLIAYTGCGFSPINLG